MYIDHRFLLKCRLLAALSYRGPFSRPRRTYATVSDDDKNPFPYPVHPNPTPHQIFHLGPEASQADIKARYFELVRAHHPDSHHAARLGATLAHARFRTIKAAYDFLSGKTLSPHPNARPAPTPQNFDPYMHELARRRRAHYAAQGRYQTDAGDAPRPGFAEGFGPHGQDDGWREDGFKERLILALGVISLVGGLFPTLPTTLVAAFLPPSSSSAPVPDSPTADTSGTSFSVPFFDLDRGHRAAVSALSQARSERQEMGAERREGVRRRVREMASEQEGGASQTPAPESRTTTPVS